MNSRATHLTEAELVDLLDGTLDDIRRRHLDGCDDCAARAAELVASAALASDVDVPEPPAFFWTQLSARVSEAVANEAAKPRIAWARAPWIAAASVVAVVWLFLTDPISVANAVSESEVTPFIRDLAAVLMAALQGLLRYL